MHEQNIVMEQPQKDAQVVEAIVDEKPEKVLGLKNEEVGASSESGSIGKFKDAESLLSAYNNLQAEFTRKCQKLSELEKNIQSSNEKPVEEYILDNPSAVEKIIKHYLEEVQKNHNLASITNAGGSGIPLSAPPKPTTLDEAKEVVKKLFK